MNLNENKAVRVLLKKVDVANEEIKQYETKLAKLKEREKELNALIEEYKLVFDALVKLLNLQSWRTLN